MKTLLTAAAVTLALGAPVSADPMAAAMAHFNQDLAPSQRIATPQPGDVITISTRSGVKGEAFAQFNQGRTGNDVIRSESASVWSGEPSVAQDIFATIAAESDD